MITVKLDKDAFKKCWKKWKACWGKCWEKNKSAVARCWKSTKPDIKIWASCAWMVPASLAITWCVGWLNNWTVRAIWENHMTLWAPMAMVFCAIGVGPMIEEYAKRIAVLGKFPWIFVTVFAFWELWGYHQMGASIAARLPIVAVHYVLMTIQVAYHKKSLKKNGCKYVSRQGYFLSWILHSTYNLSMLTLIG